MSPALTTPLQDTTVVELARDGLAVVSAWTLVGLGLAFLAILVVLVLVLAELRILSRTWSGFVAAHDRTVRAAGRAREQRRPQPRPHHIGRADRDRPPEWNVRGRDR